MSMRAPVPVRLDVSGRASVVTVWIRQFTARDQMRWRRACKEVMRDEDTAEERLLELCIATLRDRIDRVEAEGEGWAEWPETDSERERWLDDAGQGVVDALTLALTPHAQERPLGKSTSGRT